MYLNVDGVRMASLGSRPRTIRFGPFELDASNRKLRKRGDTVKLQPKQFDVLLMLVERAGQVVSRDEIREHIWDANTFVDFERSINFAINQIRGALGDDVEKPRFVETIPRHGYRFLCRVEVSDDTRGLVETKGQLAAGQTVGPIEYLVANVPTFDPLVIPEMRAIGEIEKKKSDRLSKGIRWKSKKSLLPALSVALILILAVGFLGGRASNHGMHQSWLVRAGPASSRMRVVPLTNLPDAVWDPAFSPDGEKIAFTWYGENPVRGDLYVQLIGGEKPLRLTQTKSGYICCGDWSPDGREIAFGRCDDTGGGVYTVPAFGGPERKLTDVICPTGDGGDPKWTADGKSLLLVDRCLPNGPRGIVLFSLATGAKHCLTAPPSDAIADFAPTLSPDQKTVAFIRSSTVGVAEVYTVALSGGSPRQLTHDGRGIAGDLMWSSDGQYIVFNSDRSGLDRVWRVPATGGAVEPETVYPGVGALSRDGRRLAYIEPSGFWRSSPSIWRTELSRPGGEVVSQKKILVSTGTNDGTQLSPDGRQLVFQSDRSGSAEIWESNADGSNPQPMTFFSRGIVGTPRWSPDGRWVAFDYRPETHSQIYLIDSERRNMQRVTSDNYENVVPSWSRDGAAIYFAFNRTGDWQIWRREVASGREVQVTRHGGFASFESYDAKILYYSKFDGGGIWSMRVGGGDERRITEALHRGYWGHFAVTEAGLYLLDSDAALGPTIMYFSFQSRHLTPIVVLMQTPVPWTANLAASRDGPTLLFAQGEHKSSITMVENFQ
jgi:Tol biopolymer transport system component/DNA-binding winged helix-turn-helix (wHTH) protein